MTSAISIRFAVAADAEKIMAFIKALADYENLSEEVTATADDIRRSLFTENPVAECLLAFDGDGGAGPGAGLGFALFFNNYSTFLGKPGLYLEDLFVSPEARGRGVGKRLLERLGQITLERGLGRMEWAVLDWNKPAIEFYQSLDARAMDDWTVYRLSGAALERLANK